RRLQEIQSSHPAMGHAGPRALQTRNARSALGGLPIGAYPAVLSLHPASENARTLPTSCFPASGLALPHFFSFMPQRIAQARSKFARSRSIGIHDYPVVRGNFLQCISIIF